MYSCIFNVVAQRHGDTVTFLHPKTLQPSGKGIACSIQFIVREVGLLVVGDDPKATSSAIAFPCWRILTLFDHHAPLLSTKNARPPFVPAVAATHAPLALATICLNTGQGKYRFSTSVGPLAKAWVKRPRRPMGSSGDDVEAKQLGFPRRGGRIPMAAARGEERQADVPRDLVAMAALGDQRRTNADRRSSIFAGEELEREAAWVVDGRWALRNSGAAAAAREGVRRAAASGNTSRSRAHWCGADISGGRLRRKRGSNWAQKAGWWSGCGVPAMGARGWLACFCVPANHLPDSALRSAFQAYTTTSSTEAC